MDHQPLRWPSRAISMSTLRAPGSSTLYMSSIAIRYADLVGALPVSMRDRVEGARLSSSATSSSLSECPSRSRRSSAPSLRLRTVGPRGTGTHLAIRFIEPAPGAGTMRMTGSVSLASERRQNTPHRLGQPVRYRSNSKFEIPSRISSTKFVLRTCVLGALGLIIGFDDRPDGQLKGTN